MEKMESRWGSASDALAKGHFWSMLCVVTNLVREHLGGLGRHSHRLPNVIRQLVDSR